MEGGVLSLTAKRLDGKVAVITGGASGIGESTARLFVHHGAKVIIADVQDDLGNSLCQQLGSNETITFVHCDVTNDDDVRNAINMAVSKYGKPDIMFNNAGISGIIGGSLLEDGSEDFKRVLDVNVYGGFLGAKHAARVMIPSKKGTILFTSSAASVIVPGQASSAYVASKHAVVGLTKNLCVELGQFGIRVNCISPYGVVTPLLKGGFGMMEDRLIEGILSLASNLKGVDIKVEDIAQAALFLASDDSKYISGLNLVVDGGFSTTNPSFLHAVATALNQQQPPMPPQ